MPESWLLSAQTMAQKLAVISVSVSSHKPSPIAKRRVRAWPDGRLKVTGDPSAQREAEAGLWQIHSINHSIHLPAPVDPNSAQALYTLSCQLYVRVNRSTPPRLGPVTARQQDTVAKPAATRPSPRPRVEATDAVPKAVQEGANGRPASGNGVHKTAGAANAQEGGERSNEAQELG